MSGISPPCIWPLCDSVRTSKMSGDPPKLNAHRFRRKVHSASGLAVLGSILLAASAPTGFSAAQQTDAATAPVVVQPGAPGKPSKTLPPSTKGTLPPRSQADVEFMQGMIMHHSPGGGDDGADPFAHREQGFAVAGCAHQQLAVGRDKFYAALAGGARRTHFHGDAGDGRPADKPDTDMSGQAMAPMAMALMPGMLTPEQMEALRKAKGAEFDHLFLTGMIQHHNGALIMVKDLFDTAGAGQEADLFNFATDADNTQRAEIRIMQAMLEKKPSKEK